MGVWPIPRDDILSLLGSWHIPVPLGPYPHATTAFGRFGVCAFGGLQQDATGAMSAWLCRSDGSSSLENRQRMADKQPIGNC